MKKRLKALCIVLFVLLTSGGRVFAGELTIDFGNRDTGVLDILFFTTLLTLLPTIILMMTSFTRIAIVFSFLRNAMGTAQVPPTQVLMGLSLMLTVFIMSPVIKQIDEQAYVPYKNGEIEQLEAIKIAAQPLKEFMLRQTKKDDMALFMSVAKAPKVSDAKEIGMEVVVPAFIVSELKRAFVMGFCLFIPFIVIDMVVSSVLMSLGMMMLPPAMIALPFKILLFILANGWDMLVKSLVTSFR